MKEEIEFSMTLKCKLLKTEITFFVDPKKVCTIKAIFKQDVDGFCQRLIEKTGGDDE